MSQETPRIRPPRRTVRTPIPASLPHRSWHDRCGFPGRGRHGTAAGEASMKRTKRHIAPLLVAAAVLALATPVFAGGWFGLHIGSDGFGLSLGFSTWEPYTSAWSDPAWSLDFTTALEPYGSWITVGGLGRVWRPAVAPGWRPYTWGRWVWTSYGWTWVSYEPWGYIPHHFGHWAYCNAGWVWAPGSVYTPAAVTWYAGGPMVGWCPAPPPGWHHAWEYDRGFDHGYRSGYGDGYRDGWADARHATWVSWNDLPAESVADRVRPWDDVAPRIGRSGPRPVPNGPRRTEVERWTGRPIPTAKVSERSVSIGGRQVRVARVEGVRGSIERHAGRTVERALDRSVARTIERRAGRLAGARRTAEIPRTVGRTARSRTNRFRRVPSGRTITRTPADVTRRPRSRSPNSTRDRSARRPREFTSRTVTRRVSPARTVQRSRPSVRRTVSARSPASTRRATPQRRTHARPTGAVTRRTHTSRFTGSSRALTRNASRSSRRLADASARRHQTAARSTRRGTHAPRRRPHRH